MSPAGCARLGAYLPPMLAGFALIRVIDLEIGGADEVCEIGSRDVRQSVNGVLRVN